jgi:hypothetical protein
MASSALAAVVRLCAVAVAAAFFTIAHAVVCVGEKKIMITLSLNVLWRGVALETFSAE